MNRVFLTIDIGGTKIGFSLFSQRGKFLGKSKFPTSIAGNKRKAVSVIFEKVMNFAKAKGIKKADIKKIAVGCPGPFAVSRGVLGSLPNLKTWKGLKLKDGLKKKFNATVLMENDANLAALGEAHYGGGKGRSSCVFVTFSTGIGGGFVHEGDLFRGVSGDAFEVGHMTLIENGPKCGCGKYGCLEAIASGTAMQRNAKALAEKNRTSKLYELYASEGKMTVELIVRAIKARDPNAKAVWDIAMNYFSIGLANIIQTANPDVIVIGGGVANNWEMMIKPVKKYLEKYAWPRPLKTCRIVRAKLGDKAAAFGGLALLKK